MKNIITILLLLLSTTLNAQKFHFNNTSLDNKTRVEMVLSQLTLDEKISLLSSNLGVPRLGIPRCDHYEGLHGLTVGGPGKWGLRYRLADGTTVHQPFPSTCFQQEYGMGETWDPELIRLIGDAEATDARWYAQSPKSRVEHSLVMRAPNADLARDPRWGRTEESFGEDAYLTATMACAMIHGLQGDNPRYWKTASLMKHFLANSNENGRDSSSSNFSERLFREYYSFPFYKGIAVGGSRAFMASYNAWNGTPMCINPVLDSITRREWGNDGIICTDGGALRLLVSAHHAYKTLPEAAAAVVKATTGQFLDNYKDAIKQALKDSILSVNDIDKAIRYDLNVAVRLGLLDGDDTQNPYASIGKDTTVAEPWTTDSVRALARRAMDESVVLLKNDEKAHLLPLDFNRVHNILLVCDSTQNFADSIHQDWYGGTMAYGVTIADAFRELAESTPGLTVRTERVGNMTLDSRQLHAVDGADVVICIAGNEPVGGTDKWAAVLRSDYGREGKDRDSLNLPDEQWIRQVWQRNPNTVLVLLSSFPYTINFSQEHLPAIIHATHGSQEQGHGIVDVLSGRYNPAGRLTQTWPKSIADLPPMMDYDITHGRTYMYNSRPVLYPFGYGLSYSKFKYGKMKVGAGSDGDLMVTIPVTNESKIAGDEVVQVYASFPDSKVVRPIKKLVAFKRCSFKPKEKKAVSLTVHRSDLEYWNTETHSWTLEPCSLVLSYGPSSHTTMTSPLSHITILSDGKFIIDRGDIVIFIGRSVKI